MFTATSKNVSIALFFTHAYARANANGGAGDAKSLGDHILWSRISDRILDRLLDYPTQTKIGDHSPGTSWQQEGDCTLCNEML